MSVRRQPAGIPTGGEFAANAHDEAPSTLAAAKRIPLADGRWAELHAGVWNDTTADAFQSGQCVAFAVERAKLSGESVRVYWREDGQLSHAVSYDTDADTCSDSLGIMPSGDYDQMWFQDRGEYPEYDDYSPDEVRTFADDGDDGFDLLPPQDYDFASSVMPALPSGLLPQRMGA